MKKFLSIILALAMTIALIPAASAEGETEIDGITIEYSFLQSDYDTSILRPSNLTYTNSKGVICYDATNTTTTNGSISEWGNGWPYLICQKNGEYITFKIRVPRSGTYTAKISNFVRLSSKSTAGGIADVYLIPCSEGELSDILGNKTPTFTNINSTATGEQTDKEIVYTTETIEVTTPGEYYFVIKRTGESGNAMRIRGLTLTQGTPNTPALIYADVALADAELDAGISEETAITLSNVYMSDGNLATEADIADITYVSSDESIAKIENGKVKAVCHGTATISAVVGDYVLGSADVTVTNSKASGVTIEYSFAADDYDSSVMPENITYENSFGKLQLGEETSSNSTLSGWSSGAAYINMANGQYVSYRMRVPEAGLYRVTLDYVKKSTGAISDMYILTGDTENIAIAITTTSPILADVNYKNETTVSAVKSGIFNAETAGEYYLVFSKTDGDSASRPKYLTLDGNGTETSLIYADISLGVAALEVNGTTTLTKGNAYLSNGESTTDLTSVTYKSTNEAVATISDTTVTAISEGTAKIQAVRADGYILDEETITVSRPKAPTVSFYAESSVDDCPIEITATDVDNNAVEAATLATLNRGASVTVNAPEKEGYLFVGWFRGSKDTGRFVWADSEYTFNAMTHTMLTAVYEEATEKAYYNFNGEFLGTEAPSSDPTMLGYNFDGWNETVYNNLTRFVAKYLKNTAETYNVTIPSGVSEAKDEDAYYYDTKVTLTSDTAVTWLRDDEPVAYGETYTFYVWDDVKITTDTTVNTMPKVILDSSKSGAYMIEYDAGDKTIIEKGIIFGNAGDEISVESCKEKMNSQRSEARGQFTASSAYTKARGYLIYKDGNEYKVIYAD